MLHSFLPSLTSALTSNHYLALLPLLLCVSALVYYGLALYSAVNFFSRPAQPQTSEFFPPVSILIPICGLDSNAYDNLASFCQQDYPTYQIIFGVQDPRDPSIAIVRQLIQNFPNVDIRLVVSDRAIGINRKVNNLANAVQEAKHEILVLADSDIRVTPNYLQQVVQPLIDPAVGVVTCMYRSIANNRLAAFEALGITTEFLPSVLVARQLEGMTFAMGATIAIRQIVLEQIGGFAAVANYLEDDYKLGNLPVQLGYQVVLSDCVVDHAMTTNNFADFLHHQTRWARGTRFSRPLGHLGLIFTFGTISSLAFLMATQGALFSWLVLGITWSARFALAWLVGVYYLNDPIAKRYLWLLPIRDVVNFILWGNSFIGNTVRWRGHRFRLLKGGELATDGLTPLYVESAP